MLLSCFDCKNVVFSTMHIPPCNYYCVAFCTVVDESEVAAGSGLSTSSTYAKYSTIVIFVLKH